MTTPLSDVLIQHAALPTPLALWNPPSHSKSARDDGRVLGLVVTEGHQLLQDGVEEAAL